MKPDIEVDVKKKVG